jgi:hypothetical protein
VEEDFVKLFIRAGFDLLENQQNSKIQEIKERIFSILQMTMQKYGDQIKYMQS